MILKTGSKVISKIRRSLRNDEDMEWGAVPPGTTGEIVAIEEAYGKRWAAVRWSLADSVLDDQIVEEDWNSYLDPRD